MKIVRDSPPWVPWENQTPWALHHCTGPPNPQQKLSIRARTNLQTSQFFFSMKTTCLKRPMSRPSTRRTATATPRPRRHTLHSITTDDKPRHASGGPSASATTRTAAVGPTTASAATTTTLTAHYFYIPHCPRHSSPTRTSASRVCRHT